MNYGGAVATAGGLIFVAATPDEKIRAFEKHTGRVLWEHQLPAGGYATPSVYMLNGRQYVTIAAGGSGKNATRSGDSLITFALPAEQETTTPAAVTAGEQPVDSALRWQDTERLGPHERRAQLHGRRRRHRRPHGREQRRDELVPLHAAGVRRLRARARHLHRSGDQFGRADQDQGSAGRRRRPWQRRRGRACERSTGGDPTGTIRTCRPPGMLYGEALGTGWLSSPEKIKASHRHFMDDGWNKVRIVAKGPRIQTWVNGQAVEDVTNEAVYKTHARGFIAPAGARNRRPRAQPSTARGPRHHQESAAGREVEEHSDQAAHCRHVKRSPSARSGRRSPLGSPAFVT